MGPPGLVDRSRHSAGRHRLRLSCTSPARAPTLRLATLPAVLNCGTLRLPAHSECKTRSYNLRHYRSALIRCSTMRARLRDSLMVLTTFGEWVIGSPRSRIAAIREAAISRAPRCRSSAVASLGMEENCTFSLFIRPETPVKPRQQPSRAFRALPVKYVLLAPRQGMPRPEGYRKLTAAKG